MRPYRFFVLLIIFSFGLIFLVYGLYDSPLAKFNKDTDVKVQAEYLNGVLTASGILFGIWAIIIANKPKGTTRQAFVEKELYRTIVFDSFYMCLGFLILSVCFLVLTAIGWFSSLFSLIFSAMSFVLNVSFLSIFVHPVMDTD